MSEPTAGHEGLASYKRKDGNEKIVAGLSEFKGRQYFSIRAWWRESEEKPWAPGKNGINLPVDEEKDFLKIVVNAFGVIKILRALRSVYSAEEIENAMEKLEAEDA